MKYPVYRWLLACLFAVAGSGNIFSQLGTPPSNDDCQNALRIEPGQIYQHVDNAYATRGFPFQSPDTLPGTCIQSLENDLWYEFTTSDEFEVYEVVISSYSCNTPAGLQALLIQSDDCNRKHYRYRACSNTQTLDTIKLYLQNDEPGAHFFIYIDGYDGTICDFDVSLKGKKKVQGDDYRYLRYDYILSELPYGYPDGLETIFENNEAVIIWESAPEEDIAWFLIERMPDDLQDVAEENHYAQVVGRMRPSNRVGAGRATYIFKDQRTIFEDGKKYRYRIVTVDSKGDRSTSEVFNLTAELIDDFFVGDVKQGPQEGQQVVYYINRKKKQDFSLRVENGLGEVIKSLEMKKVTAPDGEVTIDMSEYPSGFYTFIMGNGKDEFRREFFLEEN